MDRYLHASGGSSYSSTSSSPPLAPPYSTDSAFVASGAVVGGNEGAEAPYPTSCIEVGIVGMVLEQLEGSFAVRLAPAGVYMENG